MSSPFAIWRKAGAPRRRQTRRCGHSRKALEVRSATIGKAPSDGGATERGENEPWADFPFAQEDQHA